MNKNHLLSVTDKWQQMGHLLQQEPVLSSQHLSWQFKKIMFSRIIAENILVFLLQYIGLMLSTLTPTPSLLWLAAGTSCAFIFMRGYSIIPGIGLGTLFAYYFVIFDVKIAIFCAIIHSLQAVFLLWCSHRYIYPTLIFYCLSSFIKFILLSGFLTAITSFMLLYVCLAKYNNTISAMIFMEWWLANLNGVLILSCALVTWDMYFPELTSLFSISKTLLCVSFGTLFIFILMLSLSYTPLFIIFFALLIACLILLISTRFGWCGAVTAICLLGLLLNLAAYLKAPLFAVSLTITKLISLQTFLGISTLLGLGIGSFSINKQLIHSGVRRHI